MKNVSNQLVPSLIIGVCLLFASGVNGQEQLNVFILAGQSNMVGHARAHTIATLYASDAARDQELLEMVMKSDSEMSKEVLEEQLRRGKEIDDLTGGISNDKIKAMADGEEKQKLEEKVNQLKEQHEKYKESVTASLVESDRVYISSIADRNKRSGKLGFGYGGDAKKIGPEYGFGLSMASKVKGPILIIKTSWGGKSLNYNFRPPSAGEYELNEKEKESDKVDEIRQNAGLNYRMMNEAVREVLANLKDHHPDYDENAGYKIAGFVWFQGFNDQFAPEFRDNYKDNMMAFVNDVRAEYKEPNMPFVIGVLGTPVTAEKVAENKVSTSQREAAKEMADKNVVSVESYTEYSHYSNEVFQKGWPEHYHQWDTVGSDRPYHYLGSGAFFLRLGDAFADSMYDLMSKE